MAITINGSGTITGITAGGLPDGVITADDLASDAKPIGVGQSWTDVTGSRVASTTYTNSTGKTIVVLIVHQRGSGELTSSVAVDGSTISNFRYGNEVTQTYQTHCVIVPNGSTYQLTMNFSISSWWELR